MPNGGSLSFSKGVSRVSRLYFYPLLSQQDFPFPASWPQSFCWCFTDQCLTSTFLNTGINQSADGLQYSANDGVWTGADYPTWEGALESTCNNWTSARSCKFPLAINTSTSLVQFLPEHGRTAGVHNYPNPLSVANQDIESLAGKLTHLRDERIGASIAKLSEHEHGIKGQERRFFILRVHWSLDCVL